MELKTPSAAVEKLPIENIMTLLEHYVNMKNKQKPLILQLKLITDKGCNIDNIDEVEKIEEEIEFLSKYCDTLYSQAVVIMNEHKVTGIPLLEDIEKLMICND